MTAEETQQASKDYENILKEILELVVSAKNANDVANDAIVSNNRDLSKENAKAAIVFAQQAIDDAARVYEMITELLPSVPPLQYHNGRAEGRSRMYYRIFSLQEKATQLKNKAEVEKLRAEDAKAGSGMLLPKADGGRRRRRYRGSGNSMSTGVSKEEAMRLLNDAKKAADEAVAHKEEAKKNQSNNDFVREHADAANESSNRAVAAANSIKTLGLNGMSGLLKDAEAHAERAVLAAADAYALLGDEDLLHAAKMNPMKPMDPTGPDGGRRRRRRR